MGSITSSVGQHNLPEDLTSMIGREREQREVSGLIADRKSVV